jgi:hypothetical protein
LSAPTWNQLSNSDNIAIMSSSQQPPSDDNATGTAPNQTTYSDASGRIFNFYATCAEKMDQENVENWKDGADTILVFVRFQ